MMTKFMARPRVRDAGVWEVLRPLLRKLRAVANHPHYVRNGNEQTLLAQLMTEQPPSGGMAQYLADMDGHQRGEHLSPMTDRNLLKAATTEAVLRETEAIGNLVNVWRLRGETHRNFCFRISVALAEQIEDRSQLLDIILSLERHPTWEQQP